MFSQKIEKILQEVQKPGRYVGGELNSVIKDKNKVDVRYAFCFPDTYEIGMSHLGMKILYSVVNRLDYAWCERVFAPDVDMEEKMRENDIRLWALESGDPLDEFDMLGFTLQYELSYSNILNMLDLAGIPLYSKDRTELAPLVVAGGPCACNGEPIADFIDIFMLGDGEETTVQLVDLIRKHKKLGSPKIELLREVAQLKGFYVPAFYDVEYKEDGTIKSVTNKETAPEKAGKGTRVELRSADPSCNPYLEMALCLLAGLDGIEKGYMPPESTVKNIFDMSIEERKAAKIESLPGTLEEAVDEFEKSEFIKEALGEHVYTKFIEAKRREWDSYRTSISQWEIDTYLAKY